VVCRVSNQSKAPCVLTAGRLPISLAIGQEWLASTSKRSLCAGFLGGVAAWIGFTLPAGGRFAGR
jgi:hypothetical protein